MAGLKGGTLQGPPSCSVCFEAVNDASERSIAKLTCGHQFHLDCIGSAFNAKGSMQCPNCRRIEHGQWLYANGGRQREDSFFEDIIIEEEYDLFPGVSDFLLPHEYMVGHIQWCPYQGSYAQFSLSLGDADHHIPDDADLVVNVLVGDNLGSSESLQPCPLVLAQTPAFMPHASSAEENVRLQESLARPHQGVRHQRRIPSIRGQWGYQPPPALAPIGVLGGVGLPEGSRWPQPESHSAGHLLPSQARYHGRRRPNTSTQSVDNYLGSQFSSASWDFAGQSVSQNGIREGEPRNNATFTQRRHEASAFRPYPSEREGQRWAPPPLSGLYGAHGILGSELPTQVGFGAAPTTQVGFGAAPTTQAPSRNQATFQAFQPYPTVEDIDAQSPPVIYSPR